MEFCNKGVVKYHIFTFLFWDPSLTHIDVMYAKVIIKMRTLGTLVGIYPIGYCFVSVPCDKKIHGLTQYGSTYKPNG